MGKPQMTALATISCPPPVPSSRHFVTPPPFPLHSHTRKGDDS